jgi:hypothetical protein
MLSDLMLSSLFYVLMFGERLEFVNGLQIDVARKAKE